ncbi:hypothetical protein [Allokutzneria multivorans]|uniref:hypothetical protein n=1 Tax=Allokutzneria multivorans TaxID=1142134 RepID=UPI0031ECF4F9
MAAVMLGRLRHAREAEGRLAFSDKENSARVAEHLKHPVLRAMSEDEQSEWQRRVPSELITQGSTEPFTVWTAEMARPANGSPPEWGVEAHVWEDGKAIKDLFVVVADANDALAMTDYLQKNGNAETLGRLHQLARHAGGRFTSQARVLQPGASEPAPEEFVLTEQEWIAALRRQLPPDIARMVIQSDPRQPRHDVWLELHRLADSEVRRVGALPDRLAEIVATRPKWHQPSDDPPSLAYWAITQRRENPGYLSFVTSASANRANASPGANSATTANADASSATRTSLRLVEVHSREQARQWAQRLSPGNPEHRMEAKAGFGEWGDDVNAMLAMRFPGLLDDINKAVRARRPRAENAPVVVDDSGIDAQRARTLIADVERLDPQRRNDRLAAATMLGRVPDPISHLIAAKFAGDESIKAKIDELYPDGIPDVDLAAWLQRAEQHENAAAAHARTVDDPRTARREDSDGRVESHEEHASAARQRGIAAAASQQRRPGPRPEPTPQRAPSRRP